MDKSLDQLMHEASDFDRMIDMITTMIYSGAPDRELPIHKLIHRLTKENVVRISIAMYHLHNTPPEKIAEITENHNALHKRMYSEALLRSKLSKPGENEEFLISMKSMLNNIKPEGEGHGSEDKPKDDGS